jgi:hypothetical protein
VQRQTGKRQTGKRTGKRQTGKRQTGKRQAGKRQAGKRQAGKRQTGNADRASRGATKKADCKVCRVVLAAAVAVRCAAMIGRPHDGLSALAHHLTRRGFGMTAQRGELPDEQQPPEHERRREAAPR